MFFVSIAVQKKMFPDWMWKRAVSEKKKKNIAIDDVVLYVRQTRAAFFFNHPSIQYIDRFHPAVLVFFLCVAWRHCVPLVVPGAASRDNNRSGSSSPRQKTRRVYHLIALALVTAPLLTLDIFRLDKLACRPTVSERDTADALCRA